MITAAGPAPRPKLRSEVGAIVLFGTIAALYFAREIFIPFAFALILTFLLTPVVAFLQRLRIGRVVSVLVTVLVSFAVAAGIGWVIVNQLVDVVTQLPLYRENISAKIEALHTPVKGQLGQAAESLKEIVRQVTGPDATPLGAISPASPAPSSSMRTACVSSLQRLFKAASLRS